MGLPVTERGVGGGGIGLPDAEVAGSVPVTSAGAAADAAGAGAGAVGAGRGVAAWGCGTWEGGAWGCETWAAGAWGAAAWAAGAWGVGASGALSLRTGGRGGMAAPLDRTTGRGGVAAGRGAGDAAGASGAEGEVGSVRGVGGAGASATSATGTGGAVSAATSAAGSGAAAFLAGAFLPAADLAADLAGAFFAGAGSSGCPSRTRPSFSALRRTRSAWASSMLDECVLTPMPRSNDRSRVSLLVRPSSLASSWTRIFAANVGSPVFLRLSCECSRTRFGCSVPGRWCVRRCARGRARSISLAHPWGRARSRNWGSGTRPARRRTGHRPGRSAPEPGKPERTHRFGRPARDNVATPGRARRHGRPVYG